MKIIKPYGQSHTNQHVREIQQTSDSPSRKIPEFSVGHDQLVIGQWISIIDKIATKPKNSRARATQEQHKLRTALGRACWELIKNNNHISWPIDENIAQIWQAKITPYKTDRFERRDKNAKGRWYKRFVGDIAPKDIAPETIAQKIERHLYKQEYRLNKTSPDKQMGLIESRAKSIEMNTLKPAQDKPEWSEQDWTAYFRQCDVAQDIYRSCQDLRDYEKKNSRKLLNKAAALLYDHYARLFIAEDSAILKIGQAKTHFPGLFTLHMQIKDLYRRQLKDLYRRQLKDSKKKNPLNSLPRNKDQLKSLLNHKSENRTQNDLIRLGRIIHYEHLDSAQEWPAWPGTERILNSPYWTSDGQSKIKRNEAFIRIWRHVLALAARTLKDWRDPEDTVVSSDILGSGNIQKVRETSFSETHFERKLPLLFGTYSSELTHLPITEKVAFLKHALCITSKLRNDSFHFKNLKNFTDTLKALPRNQYADTLWQSDWEKRNKQLAATLQGIRVQNYYNSTEVERLYNALTGEEGTLPLPRFRRLLDRVQKNHRPLKLPDVPKRDEMEKEASLFCQYNSLKMLYEGPFRAWLKNSNPNIRAYMERAVTQTTKNAQDVNSKDPHVNLIEAKAKGLLKDMATQPDISKFFFTLSQATAKEMQVQRGYEHDGKQAQLQSRYIENFKCDVLAFAFADYLKASQFDYILDLTAQTQPLPTPSEFSWPQSAVASPPNDWQSNLYLLLHFAPVDEVSKLLHQLRKWQVLTHKGADNSDQDTCDIENLQQPLVLYLFMHDAKHQGSTQLSADPAFEAFQDLFERKKDFHSLHSAISEENHLVPVRGLREIMRFGHLPVLKKLCQDTPVTHAHIQEKTSLETQLADMQRVREDMHALYVKNKEFRTEDMHALYVKNKEFRTEHLQAYAKALKHVARHRTLSAHVHLTNHVRLHRLLMSILGRLLDYSGLWERDLYFTTLAKLYQSGKDIENEFTEDGLDFLNQGRIVEALRNMKGQKTSPLLKREETYIRNAFAHFNMLQQKNLNELDLNEESNNARELMAYDRKLKNAVTKSIKDLLLKEGIELSWQMENHEVSAPTIAPKQAQHLQKARVSKKIEENLHGRDFLQMVGTLFSNSTIKHKTDITDWSTQDFEALFLKKNERQSPKNRTGKPKNNHRNRNKQFKNKHI